MQAQSSFSPSASGQYSGVLRVVAMLKGIFPPSNFLTGGSRFSTRTWWNFAASVFPSILPSAPVPTAVKPPTAGRYLHHALLQAWYSLNRGALAFCQILCWALRPKRLALVSSDHGTFVHLASESSWCVLANLKRDLMRLFLRSGFSLQFSHTSQIWTALITHTQCPLLV